MAAEPPREFLTGVDCESLVDVAEVVFDGLRAEEQRGGGFPRGPPAGEQQRNLELLRCQVVDGCAVVAPPVRFTGSCEFGPGTVGPGSGTESVEVVHRRAQLLARKNPVPRPPQPLPESKPRTRRFERVRCLPVQAYRALEGSGETV